MISAQSESIVDYSFVRIKIILVFFVFKTDCLSLCHLSYPPSQRSEQPTKLSDPPRPKTLMAAHLSKKDQPQYWHPGPSKEMGILPVSTTRFHMIPLFLICRTKTFVHGICSVWTLWCSIGLCANQVALRVYIILLLALQSSYKKGKRRRYQNHSFLNLNSYEHGTPFKIIPRKQGGVWI